MSKYPYTRARRLRAHDAIRALTTEYRLHSSDLVYPVFVKDMPEAEESIAMMPGQVRYNPERLLALAPQWWAMGLKAIALFPIIPEQQKDAEGSEAVNPGNLICHVIRQLKRLVPEMMIIADVALDPYTAHGQDGLIDAHGTILNDVTCERLAQQALCLAQAGADVVAPSDMMDGRIEWIRDTLDEQGHENTIILAYSCKYASHLYGPFRQAVQSDQALGTGHKRSYQMDFRRGQEALLEARLDIDEGADLLMVKPGLFYLDTLYKIAQSSSIPVWAYQVSGEYSMIKQGVDAGFLAPEVIYESLIAFKRAGAGCILSYFALDMLAQRYPWPSEV